MDRYLYAGCISLAVCGFIISGMVPIWNNLLEDTRNGRFGIGNILVLLFDIFLLWANLVLGLNTLRIWWG